MGNSEDAASVRVELADDADSIEIPVAPDARSGRGRAGLGALVVALGLVAVLVFTNRPDDGTNAAGTPITIPTTTALEVQTTIDSPLEDTSRDGSAADDSVAPTTTSEPTANDLETVPFDAIFLDVIDVDLGWIGLAFEGDPSSAALFRSLDGLNWDPLASDTLPPGDLLGFDRIEGTYRLAVDENESWSDPNAFNFDEGFPGHRISVWSSVDAVTWEPSGLPTLEGTGFPYPISFGEDGYVVPMVIEPEVIGQELIDLLAPFVDAETAVRACSRSQGRDGDALTVVLRDCDNEIIAELAEADYPDTFDVLESDYCFSIARESSGLDASVTFVASSGDPVSSPLPEPSWLFGQATASGFLTARPFGPSLELPECGGAGELSASLLFGSAEAGFIDVSPATTLESNLLVGPLNTAIRGSDGQYYAAVAGSVWAADEPFEDWEEILQPPISAPSDQSERMLMLDPTGRTAVFAEPDRLSVAIIGGEWVAASVPSTLIPNGILVSTDDYVILQSFGPTGLELVKVPIPQ